MKMLDRKAQVEANASEVVEDVRENQSEWLKEEPPRDTAAQCPLKAVAML